MFRYYCPMRPPEPGAIPMNGLLGVYFSDDRALVKGCARPVWGWVDYTRELTPKEIDDYELIPAEA